MSRIKKSLMKGERGQSMLEYILVTSLVGIFCLGAMKLYGKALRGRIENMKEYLTDKVEIRH